MDFKVLKNKLAALLAKFKPMQLLIKFVALVLIIIAIEVLTYFSFKQEAWAEVAAVTDIKGLDLTVNRGILVPKPLIADIIEANRKKPILEEQERIAQEREDKITRLVNFLRKQGSPVANYDNAAQIIDLAEKNNADYRVVIGIMGVESGFCRAPYQKNGNTHNCFGYLNGVKYASYTAAFNDLVPKISRQYVRKYGTNYEALSKAYGEINWQHASAQIRFWVNSL